MKVFTEPGHPECYGSMQRNYTIKCATVCTWAKGCAYLTLKYREQKERK